MHTTEEILEKETAPQGSQEQPKPFVRVPFRRRQFLIDRKGQLLATAKIAGVVLALLVLLNVVFSLWSSIETHAIVVSNPELTEEMESIDQRSALILAGISLMVLAIVIVRSIVLTHRTAGAAFNLERCLDRVAAGDYETKLKVRSKDNLRNLQDPFNQMTRSLRSKAAKDYDALIGFAEKIEELGQAELAQEVRALADAKAQVAGSL